MDQPQPRRGRLSHDTDRDVEDRQIAAWRAATTAELAQIFADASNAVRALALADLRSRHPDATERELIARYAALTMGRSVAERA